MCYRPAGAALPARYEAPISWLIEARVSVMRAHQYVLALPSARAAINSVDRAANGSIDNRHHNIFSGRLDVRTCRIVVVPAAYEALT